MKIVPQKRKYLRKISDKSGDEEHPFLFETSDEREKGIKNITVSGRERTVSKHIFWKTGFRFRGIGIFHLWGQENCTEFDDVDSECGLRKK